MKRWTPILLMALGFVLALPAWAQTQTPELTLRLRRDFGFGAGNQMQGAFSLTATGPDDLTRVDFLIDGQVVHSATQAPFTYSFNTSTYGLGSHTLSATGVTAAGVRLSATALPVEFVSPEVGWQTAGRIALPILGVVLVVTLLGTLGPVLLSRGRAPFQRGVYGIEGGAVCPRCGLPFSRHALSLHVLASKLERCPHCGRWAFVGRASPQALAQAEARLDAENVRGRLAEPTDADRLRQRVDESRFEDS